MSYQDIYQRITAMGTLTRGSSVTLNRTLLGDAVTSDAMQQVLGTDSLALNVQYNSVSTEVIVFQGFCTVLSITDAEFKLQVDSRAGDFTLTMEILLPSTWKFSTSFPDLPAQVAEEKGVKKISPSILDRLSMGASKLIFSNRDLNHEGTDLVRGLNFKGDCFYSGLLMGLGAYIDFPGPVPVSGQVQRYLQSGDTSFAGVSLKGDLQFDGSLGTLEVQRTLLHIKSAVKKEQIDWSVDLDRQAGVYFLMETRFMGRDMQVMGRISEGKNLDLSCAFTDFAVPNLNMISQSTGGSEEELSGSLPSGAGAQQGIHITDLGLGVDFKARKVKYLSLGVAMGVNWSVVEGAIELENVGIRVKVGNPFESGKRNVQVSLLGTFALGDATVGLSGTYPGYEVAGQLISGNLKVGAALNRYLPGVSAMSDMTISKLVAMASPTERTFTLVCDIDDLFSIPVGNSSLNFERLNLYLNRTGNSNTGMFSARLGLGSASLVLSGIMANQFTIAGTAENLSLHELLGIFSGGAAIPDEVPEVMFSELNVSYSQSGDFSLVADALVDMDTLPFDSSLSTAVGLTVARQGGNWSINVSLSGTGPVNFVDGFRMDSFSLNFSYASGSGWTLGGTIAALVANKSLTLSASYVTDTTGKQFMLSAVSSTLIKVLDFTGLFHFSWKRVDMSIATTVVEGQPARKSWSLRMDSRLSIPNVATMDTSAEIAADTNGKRFIKIKPLTVKAYNLSIGNGIGVGFKPLEFSLSKDDTNSNWKLVGVAGLGITGVTGKLGKSLPSSFTTSVTLSKTEAKVELNNPFTPFSFPLPKADGQDLGKFVLQIMKIGVSLKPSLGLTAELGLGFPKELNTYFKRPVFREYQEGNVMTMSQLTCTVLGSGIGLKFITSPFQSGSTNKAQNGEDWINFNFGEYGEIAMKMPEFKYDMGSTYFEASGGFKIVRDLFLPLTPLRNFLDGVGMGAAKNIFPEKLPIKGLSLVDSNNNFKTEDLISMLGDIPSDVKSALRGAGNLLNRFPDGFKSYLKFEIPTQLEFKFGFSPLGRVSFALSAPVEPIRFLYPGMVQGLVPMPGLIGIELRKLNIGTLASGSLFYGDIDAVIDMYDLPSLVTSLALPTDPGFPLPTSDELQRRIILKNVFSIIPLSQGVPVPVPVFHDEIGFEYMGLEGIGIQAHMGIPQPDFAKGGTDLLKTLVTFFKDRSYKLDPNTPPGGQQIKFRFHDEYLQAPEYLGGGRVGTSDTVIEIGTWKYVAQLMNFCKRFAMEHLIASIPLENRLANKSAKLAFFEVDGQYLITTPEEFDNGAYTALGLNADQRQDFHDVLPGVQTNTNGAGNGSSGLVMFLRGAVRAGSIFEMQACYGLAISGTMGFNTGFKFEGKVGGFIEAEIKGALLLNAKDVQSSTTYPAATPVAKPKTALPKDASRGEQQAMTFNGTSTYLEIPYSNLLDVRQYTVEMWVDISAPTTEWVGIIGRESGNFGLMISKRGEIYAYGHSPSEVRHFTVDTLGSQFKFNQWQHIAYTFDGDWFFLYINGKFASSYGPWDGNQQIMDATPIIVGRDYYGSNPAYLKGRITELRIWKRAKQEFELSRDCLVRMRGSEPNLVALYPLDSPNGSIAPDFCNGLNAKVTAGSYGTLDLRLDQGVPFNGAVDKVVIPINGGMLSSKYTLQFRFRFAKRVNLWTTSFQLFTMPNSNQPLVIGGGAWMSPLGETAPRYITVTVVVSGTSRKTFVEGALIRQETVAASAWKERITIGGSDSTNVMPLQAHIMDFQIWTGAKSNDWVGASYHNPTVNIADTTLLNIFRFPRVRDGFVPGVKPSGIALMEVSELDAYRPTFTPCGLRFNNKAQVVTVPMTEKLDLAAYTVELWFKPELIDGEVRFIARFLSGNPKIATVSGAVEHRWLDEAGTYYSMSAKKTLFPVGKWAHIAATHNGTEAKLYVNGILVVTKASAKPLKHNASEIIIGRNSMTDTGGNLNGCVDELRVWSRARTGSEILASMNMSLVGNEPGLVAYYPMNPLSGGKLIDRGPHALHGTMTGFATEVTSPAVTRCAVQAYGHSHLRIGGHEIMVADMRLKDDQFWFKGKLNLFPDGWGVRVYGDAEAYISKEELYLYASTDIELCGLKLAKSRTLITHERVRLEGEWLGIYTLLDVQWAGKDPHFKGELSADWEGRLQFGAIYIKGVRVCDNLKLDFKVGFKIAMDFDRNGFAAGIGATFMIEGVGFSVNFNVKVAPDDLMTLVNQLRDVIARDAEKYLAHIFSDALKYAEAVWNDSMEFFTDTYTVVGKTLSRCYTLAVDQIGQVLQDAGATCEEIVQALCNGAGATLDAVAKVCNNLGYELSVIAGSMSKVTGVIEDIGKALNAIGGKTATQIADAFKRAGWDIVATSHGVMSFLNNNWKDLMNALDEPFEDIDVVKLFKDHYRKSMKEIAGWHKELSYAVSKSYDYLKVGFNTTDKAVAQAFRDVGYSCSTVCNALKRYVDGETAGNILKTVGYGKDEIKDALSSAYNWSTDTFEDWWSGTKDFWDYATGWI